MKHSESLKSETRTQINWSRFIKDSVWTEIVREKIKQQECFLRELGKEEEGD